MITAPEVALIGLALGLVGGFVGWLARGATFFAKRRLTGASRQEKATFYQAVADIAAKMKAAGASPHDVAEVAKLVTSDMATTSPAVVEAIAGDEKTNAGEADDSDHPAFWSNYAMKMRAGAKLEVCSARLESALTDLRLLMRDKEQPLLEKAQAAWMVFRDAQIDLAYTEYLGGTHASLAGMLAGLAETERRLEEIQREVRSRKERYG